MYGLDTSEGIVWKVVTAWAGSARSILLPIVADPAVALAHWGVSLPLALLKMSESEEVDDLSPSELRARRAEIR